MGVYINMEKPKECGHCDMFIEHNSICHCYLTGSHITFVGEVADDCPLIEIDEPKVGKWIDTNMTCYGAKVYKCSVCDNEIDEMPTEMGEPIWNYCPNCGAKMEGKNDN